ncbi:ABC transporter permease [Faecalicatena sp. AGMB00832]|uniref:ABC transporter permease n=1 Tax=Faecalicatena faecalis TaxID=2726362 RepID=A0ABS6D9P8_9FIRM|nr:ABC transporter permease [Faecalicatena faecalis]MBU3878347.1 ABC transporter permease [Faecalicatena faecalis]
MTLIRLSFSNFKRSVHEYGALILALSFSIFIFFNFQNIIYSDSMDVLQSMNKDYIDMVVMAASVVFGVFLFFFIWYATNVFLNQRKKEIGIYTFMGLDNARIGKMYALEAAFIGLFSLIAGLAAGAGFSKLFQMLLLKLSDIQADIRFSFTWKPVLTTSVLFLVIFGIMIIKGYVSILRSSVLNMLSGAKQEEMKPEKGWLTLLKVIAGIGVLAAGYVCAVQTGEIDTLGYALMAVILVIVGTYLLFGGAIPYFVRRLTGKKHFLYQKQRTLWLNSLSYRIQRNYRTYAMVTILMICAVTVLGMSIAMKQRYDKMVHFKDTFTIQVVAQHELDPAEIKEGIEQTNKVEYSAKVSYLMLDPSYFHTKFVNQSYAILPYSEVKNTANQSGLPFEYAELKQDEVIELSHVILMSFVGHDENKKIQIGEDQFTVMADDDTPFLGNMQEAMSIYVVNDEVYKKLEPLGLTFHLYNYKLKDPSNLNASMPYLKSLAEQDESGNYQVGISCVSPESKAEAWIRVMYSLCVFMFVTLILAGSSIIFIKLGNDSYEDKERYQVLMKLGIGKDVLGKSIKQEIRFTYYCPFVLMAVTSWFAIKALGNVMKEDLFRVNIYSAVSVLVVFTVVYLISVKVFRRRVLGE